jgi:hypothetical protein
MLSHHPEEGEQLPLLGGQRLAAIEGQFLLLPSGTHWYNASVLFRLLVLANLIKVLLGVVILLVAVLVFGFPWGRLHSGSRPKANRPN